MYFDLTDEQEAIRSTARDFLASRFKSERMREIAGSGDGTDEQGWTEMAELGWAGLALKMPSSFAASFSRPPSSSPRPTGSCWTAKVACHGLDSVKSLHLREYPISFPAKGSAHSPLASLGRINPVDLSNKAP